MPKTEISGTIEVTQIHSDFLCKLLGYPKLEINGKDLGYIQKMEVIEQKYTDKHIEATCQFKVIKKAEVKNGQPKI